MSTNRRIALVLLVALVGGALGTLAFRRGVAAESLTVHLAMVAAVGGFAVMILHTLLRRR